MKKKNNKWHNLKDNLCPTCDEPIHRKTTENYICQKCGFYCRLGKAREVIGDLERRSIDVPANEFLKKHGCYISPW